MILSCELIGIDCLLGIFSFTSHTKKIIHKFGI